MAEAQKVMNGVKTVHRENIFCPSSTKVELMKWIGNRSRKDERRTQLYTAHSQAVELTATKMCSREPARLDFFLFKK